MAIRCSSSALPPVWLSTATSASTGPSSRRTSSATPWTAHRSEEHTSELQSRQYLVCRLLLEKKNTLTDTTCNSVDGTPIVSPDHSTVYPLAPSHPLAAYDFVLRSRAL